MSKNNTREELSEEQLIEKVLAEEELKEANWLEKEHEKAAHCAGALGKLLECKVTPSVYVIAPFKDVAVAYIKTPTAKQGMKLMRIMGEDFDNGLEMAAKAQLIREADVKPRLSKKSQIVFSDTRFMDVNGKYDEVNDSELNMSLLLKMQTLISPLQDTFKKK